MRTQIPHPAGHSPHTEAYQVATPGVISSGGTTYGISFSTFSVEQPNMVAPAPEAPTTRRKSRRLMPPLMCSRFSLVSRSWS